jgi:hypothetical protein
MSSIANRHLAWAYVCPLHFLLKATRQFSSSKWCRKFLVSAYQLQACNILSILDWNEAKKISIMSANYMAWHHSRESSTTTIPTTIYLLSIVYRNLVISYLYAWRKDPIEHMKTSQHCIAAPLYRLYHQYMNKLSHFNCQPGAACRRAFPC